MNNSRRIGLDLLDDVLKNMINTSAKIIPVDYNFVLENSNPNNYEFVVIVNECEYKNHIFRWDSGWTFIGANDVYVTWEEIKHKPTSFTPTEHTHDFLITTHNHDDVYSKLAHTHDYSPSTHNHDAQYASKEKEAVVEDLEQRMCSIESEYINVHVHDNFDVLNKLSYDTVLKYDNVEMSMATHNHDGAYYKKADIDSKLLSKLDKVHADDTALHLTADQQEKILNTTSSAISSIQPTTDIWYKKL